MPEATASIPQLPGLVTSKRCTKCGQQKQLSDFHRRSKAKKDGYASACKVCRLQYEKIRFQADKRQICERKKVLRHANPDAHKARGKKWQDAHPENMRARARQSYLVNREAVLARQKERRLANPGIWTAHWNARRARKVAAGGTYGIADIRNILVWQKGKCAYCRTKLGKDYHVDHILPLAKGGTNDRRNLQLTCAPCNLSKNSRHPAQYARMLGMLL